IAIGAVSGQARINGNDPTSGPLACSAITAIEIDGGPGANLIDLRGVLPSQFASLGRIRVSGGPGQDTLITQDLPKTWSLTALDEGSISGTSLGGITRFTFSSIENLVGGSLGDDIQLGPGSGVSGVLDGGAGDDSLTFEDFGSAVQVTLNGSDDHGFRGTATALGGGFLGIDRLIGGGAADTLIGEDVASTWT